MQHSSRVVAVAALLGTLVPGVHGAAAQQAEKLSRSQLLVTSDWLAAHLDDPKLVLLHVGEKGEYDAGHIRDARFLELQDISTPPTRDTTALALEMLPIGELRERLERLGISDDSRIVVYYGNDWVSPSTRVLLTLQYAGLGARASLLDGGMQEWKRTNHPLTTDVAAEARPGHLTSRASVPLIVDADFVKAHVHTPGYAIVDARNTMFYDGPIRESSGTDATGRPRPRLVPAHVPGAVNIVFESVFDETNHLLPAAELREIFTRAGVKSTDTVVGYCHVGQQATAVLFAARTLGYDVKLYDGSFQDWERRKLPVESSRTGGQ